MFDTSDDTKVRRPRRVEVFTGPERRRDWPDERKAEIVAKTLAPGVNVSEIARQHEINPQQLFGWRNRFRVRAEALLEAANQAARPSSFAPVLIEAPPMPQVCPGTSRTDVVATGERDSSIEVVVGTVTLRIRGAADAKTLALVLKALKVLA
jgi:transposase